MFRSCQWRKKGTGLLWNTTKKSAAVLLQQACSWLQRLLGLATETLGFGRCLFIAVPHSFQRLTGIIYAECASIDQQLYLIIWPSMCLPFPGYCSHLEGEALYPEHCTLRPHPGGAVQCSKGPLAAWGGAHWAGVENPLRGPTAVLGGTDFCFFSAFCMCYHCINQSPLRNRAFRSASLPLENLQSNTHRLIGLGLRRAIREQVCFVPPIRQAHQHRGSVEIVLK